MNATLSCDRLWRKRLSELDAAWPEFLAGRPTGLHKTRVASRRIREAMPIVGACAPVAKVRKLGRKMRELTRYLGPIRELDVELEILDAGSKGDVPTGRALEMVRREIASQRQALRRDLTKHVPVADVRKLIKKLERVGAREEGRGKKERRYQSEWRGVLASRLMRRAKDLRFAVEEAGSLYVPERIHGVRIAAKKLRYTMEIAQEAGVPAAGTLVRTLKRHQDRLGRLHDLQTLLKHVRETEGLPTAGARVTDLAAYAEVLEQECRRLHAGFVAHREDLIECVRDVRQQLVPALTLPSRHQAHVAAAARPAPRARMRAK